MIDVDALHNALPWLEIETQPQKVKRRSRDFYWYSPILREQLDRVTADCIISPRSENDVVRILKVCHDLDIFVTVRGCGTGNYGQSMPLLGGVVIDLARMNNILEVGPGWVRTEPGAIIGNIDNHCQDHSSQELRFHPSTKRSASIGGFVAGGSSGVGSITWGLLRDAGNILKTRVVTMEAVPQAFELRGDDIQKVNHAYGTNGVITELTMPLAPAYRWVEVICAFDDFEDAVLFADQMGRQDGIAKKLITVMAGPIANRYLFGTRFGESEHVVLTMIAENGRDAFRDFAASRHCRIESEVPASDRAKNTIPLYEYTWNHTTLHAMKVDRTITYLQTLFPPPDHCSKALRMYEYFGDEVPMHLEFVRFGGEIACFGLQLVRYSSPERLAEIIANLEDNGCPVFNPHAFTLEEGGMKKVDALQLAFKKEADPKGLMNPGKMLAWDQPDLENVSSRSFLYE